MKELNDIKSEIGKIQKPVAKEKEDPTENLKK